MLASRATVHRCCIDTSSNSCFTKIAFWRKWAQNCVIMPKSHLSRWSKSLPDLQMVENCPAPPPQPRQYKLYQLVMAKPSLENGLFNQNRFPRGWGRAKSISDLDMVMRMTEDDNWRMRPYNLYHDYIGEPERPEQRQGRYRKKQSQKKSTNQRYGGIRKSSHQPQLFGRSGSNLLSLNRLSHSETNLKQSHLGDFIRYGERFLCPMNVPINFSVEIRGMQSIWLNLEPSLVVEGVGLQLSNCSNSTTQIWATAECT